MTDGQYDLTVYGATAGGFTLALAKAAGGMNVLVLDAGMTKKAPPKGVTLIARAKLAAVAPSAITLSDGRTFHGREIADASYDARLMR